MSSEIPKHWHEKLDALEVGGNLPVTIKQSVYSGILKLEKITQQENSKLPANKQKPLKKFSVRAVEKGSEERKVWRTK